MQTEHPRVYSNAPLPPGRILRREIDYRGISRTELAREMGFSVSLVEDVINADAPVTPEIANAIEQALGIPAYLWTRVEASYRATLAHNEIIEREGPFQNSELDGDDDDYTYEYDDEPSSASILRDEGEKT